MDTKQINSQDFPAVYKALDIDLSNLGCVMIDVESVFSPTFKKWFSTIYPTFEKDLVISKDKARFWIDGLVAEKTAHCTLLYGLLEPANDYKSQIEQILKGWNIDELEIESVGSFDSPYPDEPYFCIVGHVKVTPQLLEGHQRLELLPHVNTFVGYKPHITLAYVKKDEAVKEKWIQTLSEILVGKRLKVKKELNLGGNK
jgi:2'-5' RNA ligase